MATLKNKRKLAAVSKEYKNILGTACHRLCPVVEIPRITSRKFLKRFMAGSLKFLKISEAHSPAFWVLGALAKLADFHLNPQVPTLSGTVPETSQNNDVENWEPAGERSQNAPHPKVELSACWSSSSTDSDQEETSHNYERDIILLVLIFFLD